MAATPHSESVADPVLPFPSRLGLLLWFVLQWVLIPVEFVAKLVWLLMVIFGDGHEDDLMRLLNAPARFLARQAGTPPLSQPSQARGAPGPGVRPARRGDRATAIRLAHDDLPLRHTGPHA